MQNQTFNAIYNATEQDKKVQDKDIVFRRNLRAVESSIDSLIDLKMEAETNLNKTLSVVGEGDVMDVQKVTELRATIKSASEQIQDLEEFRDDFFSEDTPTPAKKARGRAASKSQINTDNE